MNRRSLNRLLLILMGIWAFALLIYAGWSLADVFLVRTPPPVNLPLTSPRPETPPPDTSTPTVETSPANSSPSPVSTHTQTSSPVPISETPILPTIPPATTLALIPTLPPTSTPLPTAAPTLSPTPTFGPSPTFTSSPTITPLYIATMTHLYLDLVGQWRGMVTIKINKQLRPSQQLDIEFNRRCQTGSSCGRYRWEAGCYGDLVLMKWQPKKLFFRNVEYTTNLGCPSWVEYVIEPKRGDTLYLTLSYKDAEGRPVSRSVTLKRR